MKITVTQEHIDRARDALSKRAPCFVCPVAQSLTDAGYLHVQVGQDEAYWRDSEGDEFTADIPDDASNWIAAFDDGSHVEPFAFDLDVLEFEL